MQSYFEKTFKNVTINAQCCDIATRLYGVAAAKTKINSFKKNVTTSMLLYRGSQQN